MAEDAVAARNFTIASLDAIEPDELAKFSVADLYQIQGLLVDEVATLKRRSGIFVDALEKKYGETAEAEYKKASKDTGTINLPPEDGLTVAVERRKKVKWDQPFLAARWQQIKDAGDNPSVFIKVEYDISETAYNGWPDQIKSAFFPARTVTPEKQKIVIKEKNK